MTEDKTRGAGPVQACLQDLSHTPRPLTKLTSILRWPEEQKEQVAEFATLVDRCFPGASAEDRASTIWRIIQEEVGEIEAESPMVGYFLRVGFPAEQDNSNTPVTGKFLARLSAAAASLERSLSTESARKYWSRGRATLTRRLLDRLLDLEIAGTSDGKGPFASSPMPSWAQPLLFSRIQATYVVRDRRIGSATTERWGRAVQEGVDHYLVRASSPGGSPDAPLVAPLLNCRAGPLSVLPDGRGGEVHEVPMNFPAPLATGDQIFFATVVSGQMDEVPLVEVQVNSYGIEAGGLTMRVQFEAGDVPNEIWWYSEILEFQRLSVPPESSGRHLNATLGGFVAHTFPIPCLTGQRYGIAWQWPDAS